ncbi:MAG: flagellar hook-basal body protein [Planctomycetota bacterium]|jgi:flagellar basal body rod protein FlgG
MDSAVYLTGNRMNGLVENLQIVATNLANANTSGFKRTVGKFQEVLQAAGAGLALVGTGQAPLDWAELNASWTDFAQGPVRRTGRPLDLAIRGEAFFVVQTPAGPRYTRKGRLYLNAQGELSDGSGNRYASDGGALSIPDGVADVTVDVDGNIGADGQSIGRLTLMDIPRPDLLVAEGGGRFRNDGPPATDAVGSEVIQGSLEESNVNAVHEMVALIGIMRAYEASARILRRVDGLNGRLIQTAA